jgi:tRNA threonylcarbamoyl adenosine modification protein (Sua5/YciO/YrdC/YwlC family)
VTAPVVATAASSPDPDVIAGAVTALRRGGVVGIPTDTVYGLAVDPWRPGATDRLFEVKGRPRGVALPVLVADPAQVSDLAGPIGPGPGRLMAAWWPGPLTIVLARRADLTADLGGDGTTVGVRCPAHAVARAIAEAAGPIATTSANRHGEPPATQALEVAHGLEGLALVVDAGVCGGEPSTVVDCTTDPPRVLRRGPIPWERLASTLQGSDGRGA